MPDTTDKPASPADHASSADVARRKLLTALKTTDVTIERLDKYISPLGPRRMPNKLVVR